FRQLSHWLSSAVVWDHPIRVQWVTQRLRWTVKAFACRVPNSSQETAPFTGQLNSYAPARNSVTFAPSGRLLATADHDGTAKLWDVAAGRQLASLDGEDDRFGGVAFSPDGRTLAAATDTGVRLWDVTEVLGTQTEHPADR